jgi:AbrB family transcriptional regulator (stage V sporulation protein T)
MTATGIVRRVDDLGRVVVPKELRRKLKWRSGAPVEIFTAPDGIICLKKYTSMGEDSVLAQKLVESMAQSTKCVVCVCDMDRIIAVAGSGTKSQLMDKDISPELENAINARKVLVSERMPIIISLESDYNVYPHVVIAPIVSSGDAEGAVVLSSKDTLGDNEVMLARTVALFLSEQLAI